MKQARGAAAGCDRFFALVLPLGLISVVSAAPAIASGCSFEAQGEGRVASIVDARSFRLEDGREIRLAGIEPVLKRWRPKKPVPLPRYGRSLPGIT
jgi:hypothetical protein